MKKERGVSPKAWKKWLKDSKLRGAKCNGYFPKISVEEGKAKMKEIIDKIRKVDYYSIR